MAEARVGTAVIAFLARNAAFIAGVRKNVRALGTQERAVRRLRRDVRAFNRAARNMRRRLLSVRGAVTLLAGTGGLGLLIRQQAQYGASLVETSRRLGITVEQLQLLQRAGTAEGLRINAINIGLQRLTRRLGDAGEGNQLLADTFRRLNVQIRDSDGRLKNTYDVLLEMADGLQSVETQAERVVLIFRLLDTEGVGFLNVLQRGREEMQRSFEEFRRLGIVATEQAERLKVLDQSFQDLANALRTGFAVAIAENAEDLERLNAFLAQTLPQAFERMFDAMDAMRRNSETLFRVLTTLAVYSFSRRILTWGVALVTVSSRLVLAATKARGLKAALVAMFAVMRAHPVGILSTVLVALTFALFPVIRNFQLLNREISSLSIAEAQRRLQIVTDQLEAAEERRRLFAQTLTSGVPGSALLTSSVRTPEDQDRWRAEIMDLRDHIAELEEQRQAIEDNLRDIAEIRVLADDAGDDPAVAIQSFSQAQRNLAQDLADTANRQLRTIRDQNELLMTQDGLRAEVQARQTVTNAFAAEALRLERELAAVVMDRARAAAALEQISTTEANATALGAAVRQLEAAEAGVKAAQANIENLREQSGLIAQLIEQYKEVARSQADAATTAEQLATVARLFEDDVDPVTQYNNQLAVLNDLLERGVINAEMFGLALDNLNKSVDGMNQMGQELEYLADSMRWAFERFTVDTVGGFESIGDAARRLADTLKRQLLQFAVRQIFNALLGQFGGGGDGGILSGLFGGGGGGGERQHGGPVHAGVPYLVGENGRPELFVPNVPGNIIPNDALKRIGPVGGAPNVNINVAVNAEASVSPDEVHFMIAQAAPAIVDAAENAVTNDIGRRSPLRMRARF